MDFIRQSGLSGLIDQAGDTAKFSFEQLARV